MALAKILEAATHTAFLEPVDKGIGKLTASITLCQPPTQQRTLLARISPFPPRLVSEKINLRYLAPLGNTVAHPLGDELALCSKM
ncbi:MAG: hypothetical protein BGO50_06770 [Rhodanobacter sp. 67-28]|nr:MAG: hypothetical protein BGO50_06770 [Rhodanobacter sp. 67-28]